MEDIDYNSQKDPWYSPLTVLIAIEKLHSLYPSQVIKEDSLFNRVWEMFAVAISILGAYEINPENEYYLQSNNQSATPDVMTAKRKKHDDGKIYLEMIKIEVVEFESHSPTNDLVEFLKNTKLSRLKAYDEKTLFICFINRAVQIKYQDVHDRLKLLAPKQAIYISGKDIDSPQEIYKIISVYPTLDKPIRYNIYETAKKFKLKPMITTHLGSIDSFVPTGKTSIDIYEALGLQKEKIIKKYVTHPPSE